MTEKFSFSGRLFSEEDAENDFPVRESAGERRAREALADITAGKYDLEQLDRSVAYKSTTDLSETNIKD